MLSGANCLLLDEPTNHLDIESMEVLEAALESYDGTVIVISHDRYLLDRIPDRIVEVRDGQAFSSPGGYDDWLRTRRGRGARRFDAPRPVPAAGERRQLEREVVGVPGVSPARGVAGAHGREKVARFADQSYWARPVPGFGDPAARVLVLGLAPAAHGGNRTGRIFTGDRSGDFLFASMHRRASRTSPRSVSRGRRSRPAGRVRDRRQSLRAAGQQAHAGRSATGACPSWCGRSPRSPSSG